jgi:hypothetical protein
LNRYRLTPALRGKYDLNEGAILVRLGRHIRGEQALGLSIILIVAFIGLMEPSVNALMR